MYDFTLPDYKKNSIINLMSSISINFNNPHTYPELETLDSKSLKKYKNIVLIIIDGLGYNYLRKQKNSFLNSHLKSSLTSTFPSSTAYANTAFHVGYPSQQHAITGWDINLRDRSTINKILRFIPFFRFNSFSNYNFNMEEVLNIKPFHQNLDAKSFTIIHKNISDSSFTRLVSGHTEIIPASCYKNIFLKLKSSVLNFSRHRRFFHAYISNFDKYSHLHGTNSDISRDFFMNLDNEIRDFINSIKNTNTQVIITADHGFTDINSKNHIWIYDIPGFTDCLSMPLTGEPRVRYCYIKPDKKQDFKRIIGSELSRYCWCFNSEQLITDNLYGLGKPHKNLFDKIGNFVLIMKDGYTLNQHLPNNKNINNNNNNNNNIFLGNHGGVTKDEMLVPLITFNS
jgi:predicted AlkP superfamily pyrophosphatase or phosphodiesterase